MTFDEYQKAAARTQSFIPFRDYLTVSALGIAGEAGEVAEHIKKWLAHGHTLDAAAVVKELGDVLWYISSMASALGATLDDVATQNIEKLQARYPEGFTSERSLNRSK